MGYARGTEQSADISTFVASSGPECAIASATISARAICRSSRSSAAVTKRENPRAAECSFTAATTNLGRLAVTVVVASYRAAREAGADETCFLGGPLAPRRFTNHRWRSAQGETVCSRRIIKEIRRVRGPVSRSLGSRTSRGCRRSAPVRLRAWYSSDTRLVQLPGMRRKHQKSWVYSQN